ncbi:transcriptional regulator with XRE-family HTH domain [Lipingzhangella halophila]|uniref:Transcriptional regulator with XRE-family HTH domain n=1 Tax=Lipingzhangella halophila TaxID=1783352 RepID=A0A7W7RMA0_9ACTN|nr:helix-turn-helix transcriptional regulator [Lipingzhangella halophila]MBB4934610.1 transcriptional regulator with XRE-family HTH domain [Lipingzhangella halophila]
MNEALRRALARSRLTDADVAAHLGVDPKTVRRWLSGQKPHPRHRWGVADLVDVPERELWPDAQRPEVHPEAGNGVRRIYPHRWAVPHETWRAFFESAEQEIGILVYAGLFLADDPGILRLFEAKARAGVSIRLLLGDPESPHAHQRGVEEGIGDAMPAKIRNALVLYRPLLELEGVELRLHGTVLYNSIYRADEQLLINQHIYGAPASATPVLHLDAQENHNMASTYLQGFEFIWSSTTIHEP